MGVLAGPYTVPVVVFIWLTIVIITKTIGQAHARRIAADQRMAMLQRGMTPEQIATVLQPVGENDGEEVARTKDPMRSLGNARRTAVVLVSIGLGIVVFG